MNALHHDLLQKALRQTLERKQSLESLFYSSRKYFGESMVTVVVCPCETDEARTGFLESRNRDSTAVAGRPDVLTDVLA